MKKHNQQSGSGGEKKKILTFFAILIGVIAIAGLFFFRNSAPKSTTSELPAVGADGYQEVHMAVNGLQYEPSTISVHAGQKVRWVIDATKAQGCAHTMYSKTLGINQLLQPGENTIEFMPPRTGTIEFSCSMGMARGQFQVV